MKKLLLIISLVISSFAFDWTGKINWAMSYDSAKRLAMQTHKPIFVDVALTNCPPCHYLATKVYTVPEIADYINKNFISVLIIADKEKVPAEVGDYFSGSTPTLMFIAPSGKLIYTHVGALRPNQFLEMVKKVKQAYNK